MAVTAFSTGTQSATVTTEHFLANVNMAGVFALEVDCINMAAGDVVELRCYSMTLTAGVAREEWCARFYGDQSVESAKRSRPVSNELTDAQALRFSLKQTFGTSRNFPWKVIQHA